jgi:hypothetical protein
VKIYLVKQWIEDSSGCMIIAAFSSEKRAKRYIEKLDQDNSYSIQEMFVDDKDYYNGR